MKLKFYNTPKPAKISSVKLPEIPTFITYKPNFKLMAGMRNHYKKFKNILVVGHGGSSNSLIGIYHALHQEADKKVRFVTTIDPDQIVRMKSLYKPKDTLVISISKSGENITQLEMTNQFLSYPMLIMSQPGTTLSQIAEKLNLDLTPHPPMYGRFAGLTEAALLPAAIAGFDVKELLMGAEEVYEWYGKDNPAWAAASVMWQLEQKGFVDVFMPVYSHSLFPMTNLIVQLCHESFGKSGKGQTYLALEAPESQHHTNQRFFGGRKNMAGFFLSTENFVHEVMNNYPQKIRDLSIRNSRISQIDKIPLNQAMNFELKGTLHDAVNNRIPLASLTIENFSPREIGRVLAFWQLYAVYGSVLRKANPFDQPQVEASKKISFQARLDHK